MSDHQYFYALGQQDPNNDPNRPNLRTQPAAPQFNPQVASSPAGYQQAGSSYSNHAPSYSQAYAGTPQNAQPGYGGTGQEQGYFPQQGAQQAGGQAGDNTDGPVSQMGGLGLGAGISSAVQGRKKKDRHAHHVLETPASSSPALGGLQQGAMGIPNQSLNANQSQSQAPRTLYGSQPVTPAMSQFPAQANAPFSPANPPSSNLEYAARPNFGGSNPPIMPSSGASGSQPGRVDPEQIPSIPRSRDGPAQYYLDHIYPTMEHHLPPPGAVPFLAHDQGNSSPKFARLTLNNIPSSSESLTTTGLPLGLVLQPLAPLQAGEQPIPILDFGETGPPRCRRCRAYINPFMTFKSGGNKFVCNMCNFPNEVSSEYFAPTDPMGVRVDRNRRHELTMGTVEFMVPKEYWAKEPVGLRWLFLVDVGQEALNKGFLESFCEGIIGALYGEDEKLEAQQNGDGEASNRRLPPGSKVGIITFDKEIYFYNLNAGLDQAQMMVMPDIEDPFVPLNDGLFVDPYESKAVITSLLTQLPTLFSQVKNPEPALLPTLNAALSALSATGGKIVCSLSALPTWGPGRLFLRDDGKIHNTENEKKLFTTEHPGWRKTAGKMVESGVGVDFFMAAVGGGYLDVATIGHVAALSGGENFYYPNFHAPRDSLKLSQEIKHTVNRETGYQALMKVRCSNGLQVSSYHGNFQQHTFGADLEFGVIDADKAIGIMFSYDGKLDSKLDAHFQSALLYTTASGQRRVRCCNVVASVSEGGMESMKFVDQDAVVNMIAKEAATKMIERSLKDIRAALTEKTVDILAGYRKCFSGSHPPGQLVLPENLKELSMYTLGLLKSRAFKGGNEPTDRRTHDMRMLKSMGDGFPNSNGHLQVPPTIRASFSRIEEGGAYLVDNGQTCLLWLHSQVSPNLLIDLFGSSHETLQSIDPFTSSLPILETHLNAQVRNIIQYLSTIRGSKALTLQMARQGLDGAEYEFARQLVEDRNNEAQSYVDWLVHVHRHIQLELAGQRKKEESDANPTLGFTGMRPPYW